MIAIDTETALASNAEPVPALVSVAICDGRRSELLTAHDPAAAGVVADVWREGAALANAPFDAFVLGRRWPELWPVMIEAYQAGRVHDVLTREKYIDLAEGRRENLYNLGDVADRRCGLVLNKADPWRKRYAELLGLDLAQWPGEAKIYALADAIATFQVDAAQEAFRASHRLDVFADAANTAAAHLALYCQTLIGICTDPEQVERVDQRLSAEIAELERELIRLGLARMGGTKAKPKVVRDTKAAMAALESLDVPITYTKRGPSLSEDALDAAALPEGHPLQRWRRLGSLQTLRKKNVPVFRRPVVRTKYDVIKATGRTGSSGPQGRTPIDKLEPWEWAGSNLQNIPREGGFRECLVPRPGNVFVISDWGGAELVTFAQVQLDLFQRSALADALREGRNPHTEFGCRLLGIPVDAYDAENPEHTSMRQIAKAWNFGKPGGMGDAKFGKLLARRGTHLPLSTIKRYSKIWRQQWPEVDPYFAYIDSLRGPDGYITIVQPRSGFICGRRSYTEACNLMFQGLAASAAKSALWWLWLAGRDPASPLFGAYQVLFVHDENVTECPADRAEAVAAEQERIMIEAFRHWCPDVPISVDTKIAERYQGK